ncbi:hypothetical protein J5J86_05615 [Aquabacter sp. L1I39]|uniref:hypothetical protein n=1 Tax=Aquabacter sp. L1I39 TaxID=2820278 RepID=UPI001ADD091E|nr:hypothetical protein [Aquabacter sp. L1I39]QTL04800.1 hypothetical protein J5J86_05615 [Aquabacter sp. L1I39]
MVSKLPWLYPHADLHESLLDPRRIWPKAIAQDSALLQRNAACWPLIAAPLAG